MPSRLLSLVLTLLLCTVCTPADGQPSDSLAALNDEFDTSDALSNWTRITDAEGWADKLKTLAVDDGTLVLEPYPSVWFYDYVGPFLFRRVEGNFMVTTQINVSGLGAPMPSTAYSLAGLLARRPRSDAPFAADSAWAKDRENYVFLVTGTTGEPGAPKIETKSAVRSRPIVKHYPRETSGWMHLRLVRLHQTIFTLYRRPGANWQIHERFYRPDLPRTLQVGLMAYGDYTTDREETWYEPWQYNTSVIRQDADMRVETDYVRFRRPRLSEEATTYVQERSLHWDDYRISNERFVARGPRVVAAGRS